MTTENQRPSQEPLDLAGIRQMVAEGKGKEIWRSLDELADNKSFLEFAHHEFPRQASPVSALSRRDFLKLVGASMAFAGLTACVPRISEQILPYVQPPEELVAGQPLYYASAWMMGGYATGVLVKSQMGRPIKVEGNPKHPASQGATNLFMQASILDLYDPDRAQDVTSGVLKSSWDDFMKVFAPALTAQQGKQGAGLRILTETVTSPTLASQMQALLTQYPKAKWHVFDPVGTGQARAGAMLAYGEDVDAVYHFDKAKVILSLDSDFIFRESGGVRYGRDFGLHRQATTAQAEMNRLYMVESSLTVTGSNADHRLAIPARQVETFARAVASQLGVNAGTVDQANLPGAQWIQPLVADLKNNKGASLVIAGERQPAAVHALAHAMNEALGNVGQTVVFTTPVEATPADPFASLRDLAQDLQAGAVELLVILGGNPLYTAPADLNLASLLPKAKLLVYQGLYANETGVVANWFIPATHYLEMWGDARAYDGTVSIIQPLIEPLYSGKSPYELAAAMLGSPKAKGYDLVRQYWQGQLKGGNFESAWQQSLSDGVVADSALAAHPVTFKGNLASPAPAAQAQGLEIVFEPDPTVWDGSLANNAWLQELPKPLTKLTWDNAALFSPRTAEKLGLSDRDVVTLTYKSHSVDAPVLIVPGQPDESVTVHLGYGRSKGGQVLAGAGFNAYTIRTSDAPWFGNGLDVRKNGKTYTLATTRDHFSMEGRDIVRSASLAEFQQNHAIFPKTEAPASLYPPKENTAGHAWGMAINMSSCIGCNACVLACQAENNIPVVGKDQVENNREMQWLRVDRYYKGDLDQPQQVLFQPVPCMHCETAPCEVVCPVEATSHSAEGINEMTYNRCVGTRYCSNNCPYKVRRFNFYNYQNPAESLIPMRNPDVTVRPRGVMEKCTFCIQRVNRARIRAQVEGRPIQDGEVKTACQQACPTNAIVFGDINDPKSAVTKLKSEPQNYALLAELGTKPRTTYLARFSNPNPEIK